MTFEMLAVEVAAAKAWGEAHLQACPEAKGPARRTAIRHSPFTYSFNPTTVGTVVEVSCRCGAKKNVTDFESW